MQRILLLKLLKKIYFKPKHKVMKKLLVCISIFILSSVSAQTWTGKGDQKLSLGINGWGNGTGISGKYDYGITNMLSVGAGLGVRYFFNNKFGAFLEAGNNGSLGVAINF